MTARPPCAAAPTFPGLCTPAVPGPGPEAAAGLARRFRQERRAGNAGTKAHRPGALPVPAAPCGRGRKAPPGHPPSSSPPHFPAPRRILRPRRIPGSPLRASRAAVVTPSLRSAICHSLSHGAEESLADAGLQGTRAPPLRGPVLPSPLLVLEGALASAPPQPGLQPSGAQRQDVGTPARPAGASLAAALGPGSAAAR